MIKRGLITSGIALVALVSWGAPLTPGQALQRATEEGSAGIQTRSSLTPQLALTMEAFDGQPAVYVFNKGPKEGYLVLSADDMTVPVLGYSDSGSFSEENIAPGLKYFLNEYARQIAYARSLGETSANRKAMNLISLPKWDNIDPLIKTEWDQDSPYNDLCPMDGNSRSYTGCVATSIAQVLNYFEYPKHGFGSITYTCESLGERLSMNFEEMEFDYDNMLDKYHQGDYTEEQGLAVANLMLAAGYSVQMEYTNNFSGAVSGRIPLALIYYFGYDKGVSYLSRDEYLYEDWASMLYENIKNGQPIIYDGTAPDGGHSFICDGYRNNGYFHMNWGWSGSSNGYFLLDALAPSSIGIGGAAGGFNFDQDAVMYIKPSDGNDGEEQNLIYQYGNLTGTVSSTGILTLNVSNSTYLGFGYQGNTDGVMTFGVGYVKESEASSELTYVASSNLVNVQIIPAAYIPFYDSSNRPRINLGRIELETGVPYRFYSAGYVNGGDWEPLTHPVGCFNYVTITKNGENSYSLVTHEPLQFTSDGIELDTKLYDGNSVKVTSTIINDTDTELSRGVTLVLLDNKGNIKYQGNAFLLTLAPGKSETRTWATTLTKKSASSNSQYYLGLLDEETSVIYYKSSSPVTMANNPGVPTITAKVTIEGAEKTVIDGNQVYVVENGNDFDVVSELLLARGYFSFPVTLRILQPDANFQYLYTVLSYPCDIVFIDAGDSASIKVNVNFPTADLEDIYFLQNSYVYNNSTSWIAGEGGQVPFMITGYHGAKDPEDTAVGQLFGDENAISMIYDRPSGKMFVKGGYDGIAGVEVYLMNGTKVGAETSVYGEQAEVDLSTLGKGIVILKATDNRGNVKSVKVAL